MDIQFLKLHLIKTPELAPDDGLVWPEVSWPGMRAPGGGQ